jgi:hypothetical protein
MLSEGRGRELSLSQKLIIDGFDQAAKGLAASTISRRRALKLTGTALLGGGLLALFPGAAGAQVNVAQGCAGQMAVNNKTCGGAPCGGNPQCVCARTVSGEKRCANFFNVFCPKRDECDNNRDCAGGEICIQVGGCCMHPKRNLCVPKCS